MRLLQRKITSYFLLVAFLFAITPKEFIHAFSGHEDTKDCFSGGVITVGQSHVHCQVLQLQINPFKEHQDILVPAQQFIVEVKCYPAPESFSFIPPVTISLRGPPPSADLS